MVSPDEHIDVSTMTVDELHAIDLEIPEHELTLFQKFLTFIELVLIGALLVWSVWAVVHNIKTVTDILSRSFIW
ncbi:MAG: hypothetical protein ACE5GM_09805 [bacterium]